MKKEKELKRLFNKLKRRIHLHRLKCKSWRGGKKPCFDCHYNYLTKIEKLIEELT